jgi:hypothetical protein
MATDQKQIDLCLEAAKKAVEYTRGILHIGSDNNWRRYTIEDPVIMTGLVLSGFVLAAAPALLAIDVGYGLSGQAERHRAVADTKTRHDALGTPKQGRDWHWYIEYCASVSEETHAGNCGEHAAVAFMYLKNQFREVRPIDFMDYLHKNHNFVILNRPGNIPIERFDEWSTEAVVCDPWRGSYGMAGKLEEWYGWTSMATRWRLPEPSP